MAGLATIAGLSKAAGVLATVATVGSTIAGIQAEKKDAAERAAQFRYQQKVEEQEADASRARGQRAAAARYRQGREIASRQKAIAAASGGGSDQSVIAMMGQTEAEVDLAARTELFNAEQQARGHEDRAVVADINARNARSSGTLSSIGVALGGISSMYDRFGRKNRSTSTTVGRYG